MSGSRPAFYSVGAGAWRDYWNLLHPPYTVWHLSYVALGAAAAPAISIGWLVESLVAFALAMGVAAHALDELNGRPMETTIPGHVLVALAALGLAGAVALGIHGALVVSPWFAAFIPVGVFFVVAYNLELFGGRFHGDLWFAVAWGGFPALTGYFAQTGRLSAAAIVVAGGCISISLAQRRLSTYVRTLRRRVVGVSGRIDYRDGSSGDLDAHELGRAPEAALRTLSVALPLVAIGVVIARI